MVVDPRHDHSMRIPRWGLISIAATRMCCRSACQTRTRSCGYVWPGRCSAIRCVSESLETRSSHRCCLKGRAMNSGSGSQENSWRCANGLSSADNTTPSLRIGSCIGTMGPDTRARAAEWPTAPASGQWSRQSERLFAGCRLVACVDPNGRLTAMRTWEQLTAEYRRLIEERDDILARSGGEPTPVEQGRLEAIAGSILNLLQEPVDRPGDWS